MKSAELSRVPGWSTSWRARRQVAFLSLFAACFVPLQLIAVGQVVHLMVVRHTRVPVAEGWFAQLTPWLNELSPLFARPDTAITILVGLAVGLVIVQALIWRLLEGASTRVARQVGFQIRGALHEQAYRLGASELLGVSRTRPEILFTEKTAAVVHWLQQQQRIGLWSLLVLILLVGLSLAVNFWLTVLVLLLALMIGRLYQYLRRRADEQKGLGEEQAHDSETRLLQSLRLAPLTAGYAPHGLPSETFGPELVEYQMGLERATRSRWLVGWWMRSAVLVCIGFVLFIIGLSQETTLSGVVLSTACLVTAWTPLKALWRLQQVRPDATQAISEILTYLDRGPAVVQLEQPQRLERLQQQLRLDHVTLADRSGKRLLDEVSLTIPAGQFAALVSSAPATPLALAGLFVRFYDPASGRILFDDVDIRRASLDSVRGQAMLVAADSYLFPGSLLDNLTCGETRFTKLQIQEALFQARALEFVDRLPGGLSTRVGRRERSLAPFDAFRVALARALLRRPALLLVEEPPADCDETLGLLIDEALQAAGENCTLLVLPTRLATLRSAQHLYLFHQGLLHGDGPHADLLQNNELYRHLIYMRFNPLRGKVS